MTDPISDMLTRIRNAGATHKESLVLPYSKIKEAILLILKKEGYILDIEKKGKGVQKSLQVGLKYTDGKAHIGGIQRVSKYSQRRYTGAQDIPHIKGGRGMFVLTTPKGVMADKQAREQNVGGEVILKIW